MNKVIIESIEWHKDQLFKLLEDDDLLKMEGTIQSVKSDLNDIVEKMKIKKKVMVRRGGKTFYREQMVGREKEEGESLERKKRTASTLLSREKKLRESGKDASAEKLRSEKTRPVLESMHAADTKRAKKEDREEDKKVQSAKDNRSLEGIKSRVSSLITEEIKLKDKGDTAGAKKLRKETIAPLLERMYALEDKTGAWDD